MGNIGGVILIFILVLASIYLYNSFIAKPGTSIANLGAKSAA